jgi:hypothetical protein
MLTWDTQALISQQAVQDFRRNRGSMEVVKKRLQELQSGDWTDQNATMLITRESRYDCRVPLYEIRVRPTYFDECRSN